MKYILKENLQPSVSSKGKQEIKYLEKFHDFCQCYANIINYSRLYKGILPMEGTTCVQN